VPPPEPARIEHGPPVSAETARRLACDAGIVRMTHDRDGNVLDVGRKRCSVPTALGRALAHRDGGCRFPGCRARFYDRHHVHAWTGGGPTMRTEGADAPLWRVSAETDGGRSGGGGIRTHKPVRAPVFKLE